MGLLQVSDRKQMSAHFDSIRRQTISFDRVLIDGTSKGRKELVGSIDCVRESAHDCSDVLLNPKRRGPGPMCLRGSSSPTAHLASGKPPAGCGRKRASSAAGSTSRKRAPPKLPKSKQPKAKRAL
ncbi:hypothetical protein XH99_09800 [Bradyrhizobium nanningense]|uniref:Uncharacterized protein n=1 Tax=Bradyrhizobium nanningense TaxID=1325118 RepID=A0A4Q0SAD8_9BRAD|nr:hypothetical protein XH99_09800 [Bradyrhizobium nanningense]